MTMRAMALLVFLTGSSGMAADLTFNFTFIAEANPFPPGQGTTFSYGDVWAENGYVYVGSDRGYCSGTCSPGHGAQGISIFSISNSGVPTFLPPQAPPPTGYKATTYFGSEMEDVEVYDGIGYFGSDVNGSTGRTGVDIVDLSIPFDPIRLSRVDSTIGAHDKVHTVSVQLFPNGDRFLYTSDNETDIVKIVNVTDPSNPSLARSLDIGAPSLVASHEVIVRNHRLYVASKRNDTTGLSCCGWTHIYDVADPYNPVLLKAFESGPRTHTALPSEDGNLLVVTEERANGNVHIYDISMINQPNDPDSPVLLSTLNRTNVGISAHSPHHPHLHGNLLFITWYEAGLQVFNITDPRNPIHVGAFDTCRAGIDQACFSSGTSTNFNGNWGVDLSMGLNRVLLSDRSRGLIVVDASGVVPAGDYDQNNSVNEDDYQAWRRTFSATNSGQHIAPLADGNYNGMVDAADYVIWRKNVGTAGVGRQLAGGNSLAVPEPTGTVLWMFGIIILATLRSQHAMNLRWKRCEGS